MCAGGGGWVFKDDRICTSDQDCEQFAIFFVFIV